MTLHPQCRSRLIECLKQGLDKVEFRNRNILDYFSFRALDSCALALPRDIQEQARDWISPDPLRDFSIGFLNENRKFYSDNLAKLSAEDFPAQLSSIADIEMIAEMIIDSFITLPWNYTVVLPFVRDEHRGFGPKTLALSPNLSIKSGPEVRHSFPEPSFLSKAFNIGSDWSDQILYLEAKLSGYGGAGSETIERFYSEARALAGMGNAVMAFRLGPASDSTFLFSSSEGFPPQPIYVFREDDDQEGKGNIWHIPDRVGPLNRLELDSRNLKNIFFLPYAFGDTEECTRLREAGQWHFASVVERNEIFQFVQAVVVLEILFNDKATADVVGIEKLIANRCAYQIATSVEHRQEVIRDFVAIYEARSNIVHKGKARLSGEERKSLAKAQLLGALSIYREVAMITASGLKQGT
jgi:hypothetical protein